MTSQTPVASETLLNTDDSALEAIIEDAHLPSLLASLSHVLGDDDLLRDEFRPVGQSTTLGMDAQGGLSKENQATARRLALAALRRFRDRDGVPASFPTMDRLEKIMHFITGPVEAEYLPLLVHELGLPVDLGAPAWSTEDFPQTEPFDVVVVGAGMSGLAAAHRLGQAGIPYTVIERSSDLGGVWLDNDYPGARLDTSNFTYSYSFAQHGGWEKQYSTRDEILEYFRSVADRFDLRRHIRFDTAVQSMTFDDESRRWTVVVRRPDGSTEELRCTAVISAVGQLNEPNIPALPGIEEFTGPSWHTARWNHAVDLRGKRVGLIGTGASAFQVIPRVAETAAQLTVFQRTPAWVIPTPDYFSDIKPGLHWLLQHLPFYHRWYRFAQFWVNVDGIRHLALVDPSWEHPVSVSASNDRMRTALTTFLEESFADRPDILEVIVPSYPPYAKRTVRDDGTWTGALKRDNVDLVTERIARVRPGGIETADGVLHEFDVLVYGTGFRASDFLSTMTVRGRHGTDLQEQWDGDARAYWGVSIPNFPNLFCLYGPNTNLNVNGSTVLFAESALEYALACIRLTLETGSRALDVHWDAYQDYNATVDAASKTLAVGVSDVNSWYKNKYGRNSQNWPLTTLDFWTGTRAPVPEHYELLR